ncbi:MAG: M20/M25/M40 family metallo-hydrolase [Cyclobacteriaceae bacterium]|nr:M20/M25/M40 family metallo-hydrolase [Cyclobacteriaceae bacterium]
MKLSIRIKSFLTLAIICSALTSIAQKKKNQDDLIQKHAIESFKDLYALLSIPNDAHHPKDIEKNIQWCEDAFAKRGFVTTRLETATVPLLLAERKAKKATKTVLVYLQIDGQPVDTSKWFQESPWRPTLKEKNTSGDWKAINYERLYENYNPDWRIFARSASDAKGPAVAFLASLDAMIETKAEPNYNIKVIMDFEEELGSPRLPAAVTKYKKELASDMFIIFDGPRHVSNAPTLSFGARGICEITITTYGPRQPVHSGNYGNYTPNPAMRLSQLLASMKDEEGRVIIPGYYDGTTLTNDEKETLKLVPDSEEEINKFLGIAEADKIGENFQESLQYPTLNIRGLDALYVGENARTLIPAQATAEIDIRLVPTSDPERLIELVKKHIESKGYHLTKGEPTEEERMKYPRIAFFNSSISYLAFQTPFDSEVGLWLSRAMTKAFGKEPIKIRTAGGSIPISPFVITLGIPAVAVPTVNADNNQHAPNENIRVGNYMEAVKAFYYILTEKL